MTTTRRGVVNNLAWILATHPEEAYRDLETARSLAERICDQTEFSAAAFLDTLAAALAAEGDFEAATQWAEKALELYQSQQNSAAEHARDRLEKYRQGEAFRDDSLTPANQ